MSAVQPSTAAPTTVQGATTDSVPTNTTSDLTSETRPDVIEDSSAPAAEPTATEGTAEAPKGMAVVESQPINEGVLAYKQPGLVKSLMYSKKFFWFSDEPVEHKYLTEYVRGEKVTDIARPNAAHATQTGKGLFFFAKRAEDKPQPQGIINLADIKDLAKAGLHDFTFKYHNHKHAFQAASAAERDGWLVALETRHAEAKTNHEAIVGSEGYKGSLEKFGKTNAVAAASSTSRSLSRHKKTAEPKAAETKTTNNTAPVNTGVVGDAASSSSDEAKASNAKSRSQSRKRSSMFGALLGKKDQHDEKKDLKKEEKIEKKEEKAEEKAIKSEVKKEEKAEKEAEKEERKEEKLLAKDEKKALKNDGVVDPAPLDAAAIASRVMADPIVPVEDSKAKEPIAALTETASPATTSAPALDAETPASTTARETTAPKAGKRGSIFGNFFGKKEPSSTATPTVSTSTNETAPAVPSKDIEHAPSSPIAPQQDMAAVSEPAAPTLDTAAPSATTETAPATATSTSPVTPDPSKANRRSSFFSNLGTKKEKKTGGVSDAEGTDGESKKAGGFGGLLRKASRAQGSRTGNKTVPAATEGSEKEAPAPISKDAPATEGLTNGEAAPASTTTTSQQTPVQPTA